MQPTAAINRFDLSVGYSEFSQRMNRKGFIGHRVLPAISVARQAASFGRIDIEALLGKTEDLERAPGASYKRGGFEFLPDSYVTAEHGAEETVDDRQSKIYRDVLRAEFISAERAVNRVLTEYESAVASAVLNTTTWTSFKTAAIAAWSTVASGKPITDIDLAREAVFTQCGHKPNALILNENAFTKLIRTAQVEDLLKYSGQDDPKNLGAVAGLSELLRIPNILIADSVKNTAIDGQSASLSRMWSSTEAMVARIPEMGGMDIEDPDPGIGRTIMWDEENAAIPGTDEGSEMGILMEEYREEEVRGSVIRARNDYQIKIIHVEAGHLITGVTA